MEVAPIQGSVMPICFAFTKDFTLTDNEYNVLFDVSPMLASDGTCNWFCLCCQHKQISEIIGRKVHRCYKCYCCCGDDYIDGPFEIQLFKFLVWTLQSMIN